MSWIKPTVLTVYHKSGGSGYFETGKTETQVTVRCIIQVLTSTEENGIGVGQATRHQVKVHVSDPVERTVHVGDSFIYHNVRYTVTDVDDGIMPENKVSYVPYVWTFTGKVNDGSSERP